VAEISIEFVRSKAVMAEALAIRRAVFIEEQGVPESVEVDEQDAPEAWGRSAEHAVLRLDGAPVATGRLLLEEGTAHNAHVGRVAVLRQHRGAGLGRRLMEALQDRARELGYPGITLAAQLHAIGFYERLGYTARGEVFLDADMEHRWMDLPLS
jgi:predicted GNAT family N-acyltransferase